jgi:hypothetical protein
MALINNAEISGSLVLSDCLLRSKNGIQSCCSLSGALHRDSQANILTRLLVVVEQGHAYSDQDIFLAR